MRCLEKPPITGRLYFAQNSVGIRKAVTVVKNDTGKKLSYVTNIENGDIAGWVEWDNLYVSKFDYYSNGS